MTEIEQQRRVHFQWMHLLGTATVMQFLRHTSGGFVVGAVLLVAPFQSSPVQICNVPEDPSYQEVFFCKANQPLHLAFGKWMPGLAELRLEAYRFHKGLIVLLPDRMALEVPVQYNTFHIVRQDILGDSHITKGMDIPLVMLRMYEPLLSKSRVIGQRYHPSVFQVRNEWMVAHSSRVIAVYNGQSGGTRNTIAYAHKSNVEVIIL